MSKTKCIVLGEQPTEVKKKPIEFVRALNVLMEVVRSVSKPKQFNFIELICANYAQELDLMYAYRSNRSDGCLFLGKWNDGVAE